MATFLKHSISAMSLRIAESQQPTSRIKQRVANCHTAEFISIQSLPAPPHTPRGQPISEVGGGPLHVRYGRPYLATDWPYCFRFPDFPRIREWRGSKYRFWIRKSAKIGGFRPAILGGTYEHPYRTKTISDIPRRVAKFRKNRWTEKNRKNNTIKT